MHWSTPAPFHCLLHPRCCHSCPCDPLCWRKNGLNSATLRRSSPPQAPSTDSSTPTTRSKETASVLQMQAETVKVVSVNYGACKSTYFHIFHLAIPYFNLKLYCFSTVSALFQQASRNKELLCRRLQFSCIVPSGKNLCKKVYAAEVDQSLRRLVFLRQRLCSAVVLLHEVMK